MEVSEKVKSSRIIDHSDVTRIEVEGKELIIVGTAHISKESAELVKNVIESERPDTVCVELDNQRFKALSENKKWEALDLKEVIRKKQLSTLLINILLASYQKKLGDKLGVIPGVELLAAINIAKDNSIPVELCDRDVRITLKRSWNSMSLWQKLKFLTSGIAGIYDKEEITEEKLAELKQTDVMNNLMNELGKALPVLKLVLIDERDQYLTKKILESPGSRIVAVVGAGHVKGIVAAVKDHERISLSDLEKVPASSIWVKIIGWAIPVIILASIIIIGFSKGFTAAGDNAVFWVLANGIPASIGSLIAFAHPFTIVISFIAAPLTSLTPLIGAGYVAAFVQSYYAPPIVKEFSTVSTDARKLRNWWQNRLLRIMLVFVLCSLGSVIGTYVGAYEIIKNLLN